MATFWRTTRLLPRLALATTLSAGLVAGVALPSYAQPTEVPDAGSRPAPVGELPLPNGSFARPPTSSENLIGPLAAEIAELQIQIDTRASELATVQPALVPAEQELLGAEQGWQTASQERQEAQQTLDELVGDSYRGAAALPPDLYIPELRGISAHSLVPIDAPLGAAAAARDLVEKRAAELAASDRLELAQLTEQELAQRQGLLEAELAGLRSQLEVLQDRNAELVAAAERERERAAQEQDFPLLEPVAGFQAAEKARQAVQYALAQLGKPYLWGAEGPDRFDCSGLMFAAYGSVQVRLPRVAADQYWGTRTRLVARSAFVARQGLLPGDLVFFASGSQWQSIHHVGMYVGNGYMVHAPNRNEVVKVSPVWWSRFYAATRVVEAVRLAPTPTPGPSPTSGQPPTEPGDPPPSGGEIPPISPPPRTTPPTEPTPQLVEVPDNLLGLEPAVAGNQVDALGLGWDIGDNPVLEGCEPQGSVAALDPPAGTMVPIGTIVIYEICDAPEQTTPPPSPTPEESPSESPSPSPSESGNATSPSAPPA